VITLSAHTAAAFRVRASDISALLEQKDSAISLEALSYTTTARRLDLPVRKAFRMASLEELRLQLQNSELAPRTIPAAPLRVGFIIAGHGSQYKSMGKQLYNSSSTFRGHIDECDRFAAALGAKGVLQIIQGSKDPFTIDAPTVVANQCAIFSVGFSMSMMWKEWGVQPSLVAGHSLGEYAGLCVAGVLSLSDAMALIVTRARAGFKTITSGGGMLVLEASEVEANAMLAQSGLSDLTISCYNSLRQVCLSGKASTLQKFQQWQKKEEQWKLRASTVLPTPFAFHSDFMAPVGQALRQASANVTFRKAEVALGLNVSGRVLEHGEMLPADYLTEQIVQPVRFQQMLSTPEFQQVDVWIEMSAKPICLPLLKDQVPAIVARMPSIASTHADPWPSITSILSKCYESGVPICWRAYHSDYTGAPIELPRYPFNRQHYWYPYNDRNLIDKPDTDEKSRNALVAPTPLVVPTPLGQLTCLALNANFQFEPTDGNIDTAGLLWLAMLCGNGSCIRTFQLLRSGWERVGMLSVDVSPAVEGLSRVSIATSEGAPLAVCKVGQDGLHVEAQTERLLLRCRDNFARANSMHFGGAMLSNVLRSMGMAAEKSLVDSAAVAQDAEEAVAHFKAATPPLAGFDLAALYRTAPLPTPAEVKSVLDPATLLSFLQGRPPTTHHIATIEEFVFEAAPRIGHVLLEKLTSSMLELAVHLYDDDGSPVAKIRGLVISSEMPSGNQPSKILPTKPHVLSDDLAGAYAYPDRQRQSSEASSASGHRVTQHTQPVTSFSFAPAGSKDTVGGGTPDSAKIATPAPSKHKVETFASLASTHGTMSPPAPAAPAPATSTSSMSTAVALDKATLIQTLAAEVGVPADTIAPSDSLEDLGVDSIMSLILHTRFSQVVGMKLPWFTWRLGLTVDDLFNQVNSAHKQAV
jgi:malonyl CoA-acyl carrier protein transacylase